MAHQHLDNLINHLLPFAEQQLKKNGSFYPYAATINEGGEVTLRSIYAENDRPDPQVLISESEEIIKAAIGEGRVSAAAICYDTHITAPDGSKSDAIRFDLEQAEGESITVLIPYTLSGEDIMYGELVAQEKQGAWF